MDKQSIISAIQNKLYWMGSNASPSIKDVNMYDFIDRAYHLVIGQAVKDNKLEYLKYLIGSKSIINDWEYTGRYMKILDKLDEFLIFIGGTVDIYGKFPGSPRVQKVALEQVSIEYLEVLTDDTNFTYFRNPKIMFGDKATSIFIVPDYYTSIYTSSTCLNFRYIAIPTRFKDMKDTDEPVISKILHLDIVEKAAELMSNTLNPAAAAQEIQNNNQIMS